MSDDMGGREQDGDALVRARLAGWTATGASSGRRQGQRHGDVLQVKVALTGAKPPIWRRLELPDDVTLDELHQVIQAAFGWLGGHLHEFDAGLSSYSDPADQLDDTSSEIGVRLTAVVPVGGRLTYTYDFGDDWRHSIALEKRVPAVDGVRYPRCTGGRRSAPPDDCGGIWAYEELLEMRADPEFVPEEGSREEWLLSFMTADFDPAVFDPEQVNARLSPA